MNNTHIVAEMSELWLHGESGGQRLVGDSHAHIQLKTKDERIEFYVIIATTPIKQIDSLDILMIEDLVIGDN